MENQNKKAQEMSNLMQNQIRREVVLGVLEEKARAKLLTHTYG